MRVALQRVLFESDSPEHRRRSLAPFGAPQIRLVNRQRLGNNFDSPTSPSDSAGPSWSETSFTGRIQPAAVGNSTTKLRTSSKLMGMI